MNIYQPNSIEASKMKIHGEIIEVLTGQGLLVQSGSAALAKFHECARQHDAGTVDPRFEQPAETDFALYWGFVLLTDHKQEKHWQPGDIIEVNAYPNGTHTPSARRFTCDVAKVVAPPSPEELRELERCKRHNLFEAITRNIPESPA